MTNKSFFLKVKLTG